VKWQYRVTWPSQIRPRRGGRFREIARHGFDCNAVGSLKKRGMGLWEWRRVFYKGLVGGSHPGFEVRAFLFFSFLRRCLNAEIP
jgi:hypothetical protein